MRRQTIEPQPGYQYNALASRADIIIGGGAAAVGKTYAELLAAARHRDVKGFSCVFFRRTTPQITNPGGLWDAASALYPALGAHPHVSSLTWRWPSSAKVKMAHLEHEQSVHNWQGSEVPLFIFDELCHFTSSQFWYMQSRNRSGCGVPPYTMASCNPDPDSFVADLIAWWIEQDENNPRYGLPIWERSGRLRFFARIGDEIVWGDRRREVLEAAGVRALVEETSREAGVSLEQAMRIVIKSLTFIPGRLEENKIFMRKDPGYRGKLMALPRIERERLLYGNWKVRADGGSFFRRSEARMIEAPPPDAELVPGCIWRAWDLAASDVSESNKDPDYTASIKMARYKSNGRFVILNGWADRQRSEKVREKVRETAVADGKGVKIALFQDPGQAGKDQAASYVRLLSGFSVIAEPVTGDKETNAEPFSAQWQAGNVDVVKGSWNALFFSQMEGFPKKGVHDDYPDAGSRAFKKVASAPLIGLRW